MATSRYHAGRPISPKKIATSAAFALKMGSQLVARRGGWNPCAARIQRRSSAAHYCAARRDKRRRPAVYNKLGVPEPNPQHVDLLPLQHELRGRSPPRGRSRVES